MTAPTRWHWVLMLALSTAIHLWALSSHTLWFQVDEKPDLSDVYVQISDTPSEVAEVAIDEVEIESVLAEAIEAIEPDTLEAVDIEAVEVVDAVEALPVVTTEEAELLGAVVVDSIEAVPVEIVEAVVEAPPPEEIVLEVPPPEEIVVEEPVAEEIPVQEPPPETIPAEDIPAIEVARVESVERPRRQTLLPPVTRPTRRAPWTTTPSQPPTVVKKTDAVRGYVAAVQGALQRNKRYPATARRAGKQGLVLLQFVLGRFGEVLSHRIEKSSGHSVLDQEAVELIRRIRFPPIPGIALDLSAEFLVPLRFSLN